MKTGMTRGVVTYTWKCASSSREICARSTKNTSEALEIAEPLVERYPQNPNFLLLLANLNAELGRTRKAAEYLHAALNVADPPQSCSHCARLPRLRRRTDLLRPLPRTRKLHFSHHRTEIRARLMWSAAA